MLKRQGIVAALVVGLAGAVAWACGPMFPNQLLDERAATLKYVPQNSFAFEAMHLLPATDKLQSQESPRYGDGAKDDDAEAKSLGVSASQLSRIKTLRALDHGDAAYDQGKDLPEDLRAYTAGAVDYTRGDTDKAATRFEQVLALPTAQSSLRSVWAAYMLGRIHAQQANEHASDPDAFQRERAAAAKAFQLARTRAVDGASDTQGLAVDSFGEEARLYLYSHGKQCTWADLYGVAEQDSGNGTADEAGERNPGFDAKCAEGISADDFKRAITLYAAQAGHGSDGAVNSLAAVADFSMRHPTLMGALIDNASSQRLLVAYALARMDGPSYDTTSASPRNKIDARLPALVDAIEKRGVDEVQAADRLASLAYEVGHYDLAARLVNKSSGPMAEWVRAKLALQKGDLAAANAAYAAAVKAFPKVDDPHAVVEPSNTHLITGEQGVLALARGEYVEAMGHLYDAAQAVGGDGNDYNAIDEGVDAGMGIGYANDASYMAERVLTVDELKSFVDARAPASPAPSQDKQADGDGRGQLPLADNLRWLLARRLMRAARYDEARAYFPKDDDPRVAATDDSGKTQPSNLRTKAAAYATALRDSKHAWSDISKAQALYTASVIAREDGMEILGYEQGPDFSDNGGSFQGGSGQAPKSLKQAYVTDGERQRYADSVAKPDYRFHYRYVAADEANQAADLLPPRSQAFAAVLCKAAGWMLEGPPDYEDHYQFYGDAAPSQPSERMRRATTLYQRYVKQGPYVAWAEDFGSNCEEPDFDRARALKRAQQVAEVRHVARRYFPHALAACGLVVVAMAIWLVRRRRRKTAV
ncbi:hypothetical protein [Dyella sp. C11]|uniref:hypothetical protein n=1 Tax=Dyella sp. C11 TaxID=2126991 RepID=UPI000D64AC56|nr:hypothetical protein [Dyella sp. C11]